MAKSDTERRRDADKRKTEAGLVRVPLWIPESKKAYFQQLAKQAVEDHAKKDP